MAKEIKPPLKPYYVASAERVSDIANAIIELSVNIDVEYDQIGALTQEILAHCDLRRKLDV